MAVEFITADAAVIKQIESMYDIVRAKELGEGWALHAQIYLEPNEVAAEGVRIRMAVIEPFWAAQLNEVFERMRANLDRRKKRSAKKRRSKK